MNKRIPVRVVHREWKRIDLKEKPLLDSISALVFFLLSFKKKCFVKRLKFKRLLRCC